MSISINKKPTIEEEYPFHLVEFVNIGRKPKIRKTDVIATKWLNFDSTKKKCMVKYPPPPYNEESLKSYEEALCSLCDAPDHWQEYTVRIRGRAKSLNEAMLRLDNLKESVSVLTVDTGESSTEAEKKAVEAVRQRKLQTEANLFQKSFSKPLMSEVNTTQKLKSKTFTKTDHTKDIPSDFTNVTRGLPLTTPNSSITKSSRYNYYNKDENCVPNISHVSFKRTLDTSNTYRNEGNKENLSCQNKRLIFDNNSLQQKILEYLVEFKHQLAEINNELKEVKSENQILKSIILNKFEMKKEFIGSIQQISDKFNYLIPFESVEDFSRFNSQLNTDKDLYEAVTSVLQMAIDSSLVISKCFVNMLKMFFSKPVAMQFIAIKNLKGKQKMKRTNFCNLMELIIKERRLINNLQTTDKELTSALSTVLSNSVSWYSSKSNSKNAFKDPSCCINVPYDENKDNNSESEFCSQNQSIEESNSVVSQIRVPAVQPMEPCTKLQKFNDAPFASLLSSPIHIIIPEDYSNFNDTENELQDEENSDEDIEDENYLRNFSF